MEAHINPTLKAFILAAEFLTSKEATTLLLLNKFYRTHLETPSWKRAIVLSQLSKATEAKVTDDNYLAILASEYNCEAHDYDSAYHSLQATYNYIKNPYGAQGYHHWNIGPSRGLEIETIGTYKGRSHVFVGTYDWGELSQDVHVQTLSHKNGTASAYVAGRRGSNGIGEIRAQVFVGEHSVGEYTTMVFEISAERTDDWLGCIWEKKCVSFPVPEGTTRIRVIIRSTDEKGWEGNYGCRFGYTSLQIA
mmetsp:Transcript_34348/g.60172  ORF Transcript_34348/g.60172 Transcript_34348/m.60172 type:complete len:249 (+) Transcript_34348:747-1493(+)